ncbi:MAG: PBSX family phage terminase large subunit [Bacillota bacterium]
MQKKYINLPEVVGGGYGEFWRFKGRYRVVKGSRASKKSKTIALYFIYSMMKYKGANLLVVRKTHRTLLDSCFAELSWAIGRFSVSHLWKTTKSPLMMEYLPTGQKIYFRGLDDPLKITSITVKEGVLCWLWIEEAYELMNESHFDTLVESIRGEVPNELFKQVTISFNPWSDKHWLKQRFFDTKSEDILAITTNYFCNEWLDESDFMMFEMMKEKNPKRYAVAGLGHWGITEGGIFENWKEEDFLIEDIKMIPKIQAVFGLDFGFTNDPTALFCGYIDTSHRVLYVFDELYQKGMQNRKIYEMILHMGYYKEAITADSAEPKSIAELRELGLHRIRRAEKGKDSVRKGIDFLKGYEIVVHPSCVNFLTEISNYSWKEDGTGKRQNEPKDDFNHLMDAMRYAVERVAKGESHSFL